MPYPGQTRTPACSLWMRKLWSTTLPLMQGKQRPASLHPPFTASKHSPWNGLTSTPLYMWSVNQISDVAFGTSLLSRQRSDWAHQPGDLPGGRRCGCGDGRPTVHPQDKAQGRRLSSPCHPDPADGATADHEGWVEGRPLFCSFLPAIFANKSLVHCLVIFSWALLLSLLSLNGSLAAYTAQLAFNIHPWGHPSYHPASYNPAVSVAPPREATAIKMTLKVLYHPHPPSVPELTWSAVSL